MDKCLPFGASIRCSHFQAVSDAVAHIVKYYNKKPLINYLDDYFFAALAKLLCDLQVEKFLEVCKRINFPVSLHKTVWGTTRLIFLGLLIDTIVRIVAIPKKKIIKVKELISEILGKNNKKVKVHKMQKICGFLNFLGKAIMPGRAFTRRLYLTNDKLKQHHHVKITSEMRLDLEMWVVFLNHQSIYARPFMDFTKIWTAEEVKFYTDASKVFGTGGLV